MDKYYVSGLGLPQGASIVTHFNKEFYYTIGQGQMLCFPFKLRYSYNQVVIELANTTPYYNVYIPTVRCWPSNTPASQSITSSPYQSQGSPTLPPSGITWNFYSNDLIGSKLIKPAAIQKAIQVKTMYWMNVQNLQNKESYFYCKFNYFSPGAEYKE